MRWVRFQKGSVSTIVAVGLLSLILLFALFPLRMARGVSSATFTGTTYTNEHFVMNIQSTGSVLTKTLNGLPLATSVYWDVEMSVNGTWSPLVWTSGPTLRQEDAGQFSEFHRVAVEGVMSDRIAIGVYFDGNATDVPAMGPKVSVNIQSLEANLTYSTYRMAWQFRGVVASAFQFEHRVGASRTLIDGPVLANQDYSHSPMGDNSLVALDGDLSTVLFGLNWDDANMYYQGAHLMSVNGQPAFRVNFGDFTLSPGPGPTPTMLIEGGGGPGPIFPTVIIYNVNVNPMFSRDGDQAKITWTTIPASACDRFDWGLTSSYGNTQQLPCGTHTITLTGLARHVTIFYRITSSKSGYFSGVYRSSFYPVDASTNKAYESYQRLSQHSNCGARVNILNFAETPGDLSFDPAKAGNPNNYETFAMAFHYEATSGGGCPGSTIQTRRTEFKVWMTDSSGVVNWFAAKDQVIWQGYTGGSGIITWGISFGAQLLVGSIGADATYIPATGPVPGHTTSNTDLGNGVKYLGMFWFNWPTQAYLTFDAIWPVFLFDQLGSQRLWDKVQFIIEGTVYMDTYNFIPPSDQWFGNCGNGCPESIGTIVLGNGDVNGNNVLDQYTNVQSGYMTAPGGP
jgi:hypothetical protein